MPPPPLCILCPSSTKHLRRGEEGLLRAAPGRPRTPTAKHGTPLYGLRGMRVVGFWSFETDLRSLRRRRETSVCYLSFVLCLAVPGTLLFTLLMREMLYSFDPFSFRPAGISTYRSAKRARLLLGTCGTIVQIERR